MAERRNVNDIKSTEAEAGVIATLFEHPDYCFHSEKLRPRHFTDEQNGYLYYAICELAKRGVDKVDAYNIINILDGNERTKSLAAKFSVGQLTELMEISQSVARTSVAEYMLVVNNVIDKAFRRETYRKLTECQNLCFSENEEPIQEDIYNILDGVMMDYSSTNDLPLYNDIIDDVWKRIEEKHRAGTACVPFKFPALNEYVQLEPGELIIVGASAKQGKSMFLLNEAIDLIGKGYSVLYLDSELSTELFTMRVHSHLTGIEFSRVRSGKLTKEEKERLQQARDWVKKSGNLVHKYLPVFDENTIFSTTKKAAHSYGTQVIIIDYFKGNFEVDGAYEVYSRMGKMVDLVKNTICGDMGLIGLGAAQTTSTGKMADSQKILRNASTILSISNKTPEEIARDGTECGNKKLRVALNRNGMQMEQGEYIDLQFNGNFISYEQATKQHDPDAPF